MIVVSDTLPLTYLHQIGRLQLLNALYGQVIIPPAVEVELEAHASIHAELDRSMLKVCHPQDRALVARLLVDLDRGECEAIVLALELKADLLLIDEDSGRQTAKALGVPRTGLLGVLLEAKRNGLIKAVEPEIAQLILRLASGSVHRCGWRS